MDQLIENLPFLRKRDVLSRIMFVKDSKHETALLENPLGLILKKYKNDICFFPGKVLQDIFLVVGVVVIFALHVLISSDLAFITHNPFAVIALTCNRFSSTRSYQHE